MRIITGSLCILLSLIFSVVYAETPTETSEGTRVLSEILLYPLGIEQSIDQLESSEIESELMKDGIECKVLNMGAYGTVITAYPTNFLIGGVGIARIIFILNEYSKMVIYESVQSDDYLDIGKVIENKLENYSSRRDRTNGGNTNLSTFMLSDSLGISVGYLLEKQISMICVMDMDNLKGFLNL